MTKVDINKKYYDLLQKHYKEIVNLFKLNNNDILFLNGQSVVRLTNSFIDFFIFNKLKTKKNNYTIRMNIGTYKKFLKTLEIYSNSKISKQKKFLLKQEIIKLAKSLYRVGKDDKVIVDEKVCFSIFEILKEFRYDYKIKVLLDGKNITIYYNGSGREKLQYYFFLIQTGLSNIDFHNLSVKDNSTDKKIKVLKKEIIAGKEKEMKKKLYKILYNFFTKNSFFKEEYYYITDIKTQWEKDLSNTIELFNDVIQKGLRYIHDDIKFDDKQIIEIIGKKLYYDKKVKELLNEFYLFRFYPLFF